MRRYRSFAALAPRSCSTTNSAFIHFRTEFFQFSGNHVACDLGAGEQHSLPFYFCAKAFDNRFRYVAFRYDVHFEAEAFDSFAGRRADGGDVQSAKRGRLNAENLHSSLHCIHAIDARQD